MSLIGHPKNCLVMMMLSKLLSTNKTPKKILLMMMLSKLFIFRCLKSRASFLSDLGVCVTFLQANQGQQILKDLLKNQYNNDKFSTTCGVLVPVHPTRDTGSSFVGSLLHVKPSTNAGVTDSF